MENFIETELLSTIGDLANLRLPDPTLLDYYNRLENREILWNQTIDDDFVEWTQQIIGWNKDDDKNNIPIDERKKIKIYINSNGGSVNAVMYVNTLIGLSKTPVITIGMGKCFSSGALLLMGGHKGLRYIFDTTNALVHDGSTGAYGDTGKVIDNLEYTKKVEEDIKKYILSHTKIVESDYDQNYRRDWWMNSDEIITYGLADHIISNFSILY